MEIGVGHEILLLTMELLTTNLTKGKIVFSKTVVLWEAQIGFDVVYLFVLKGTKFGE